MSFDPKGNWETVGFILPNTSKQTIFTVPTGFWFEVAYITISLGTGSVGTNAVLSWFDSSASKEYVLNDAMTIAQGVPGEWQGFPLNMEVNDQLYVTAGTNYHVIVTFHRGSRQPKPIDNQAQVSGFPTGFKR